MRVWKPIIILISGMVIGIFIDRDIQKRYDVTSVMPDSLSTVIQRRDVDKELVRMDIHSVGKEIGLSARQQEAYIMYIDSAATRYKIPHILLHAITSIESSYDPTQLHPPIFVNGKSTRAVGLTGVVWEYHKKLLISEGVATTRLELSEPAVNIMASACILRSMVIEIVNSFARKGRELTVNNLFDELVRRYYGAYNESYKQKMLSKIKDTAGKQWMRRVAQDILAVYNPATFSTTTFSNEVSNVIVTNSKGRSHVVDSRAGGSGGDSLLPTTRDQ